MEIHFNLQATIGLCNQYKNPPDGECSEISIVVSPKKVIVEESTNKLNNIDGCNMFKSCFNKNCWYSIAARQSKKV